MTIWSDAFTTYIVDELPSVPVPTLQVSPATLTPSAEPVRHRRELGLRLQALLMHRAGLPEDIASAATQVAGQQVLDDVAHLQGVCKAWRLHEGRDRARLLAPELNNDLLEKMLFIRCYAQLLVKHGTTMGESLATLRAVTCRSGSRLIFGNAAQVGALISVFKVLVEGGVRVVMRLGKEHMLSSHPDLELKLIQAGVEIFTSKGEGQEFAHIKFTLNDESLAARMPKKKPRVVKTKPTGQPGMPVANKPIENISPRTYGMDGRLVVTGLLLALTLPTEGINQ